MSDEIKVSVVKFGTKKNLMMLRYTDPGTGRTKTQKREDDKRSEALKPLVNGKQSCGPGVVESSNISWVAFRERYEAEVLPSLKATTDKKIQGVFNAVEKHISPQRLRDRNGGSIERIANQIARAASVG